jgi:aryl-alcohol dehydrogenase-like predicted oxidoreductase
LSALSDLIHSGKARAIGTSTFPASEIVEAQWVADRRGLERFRTEQPPYSIINRSIEREVLPTCQRYGMGTLVWSPLGQGLLTGRHRKGRQNETHRSGGRPQHFGDERKLDVVEQLPTPLRPSPAGACVAGRPPSAAPPDGRPANLTSKSGPPDAAPDVAG